MIKQLYILHKCCVAFYFPISSVIYPFDLHCHCAKNRISCPELFCKKVFLKILQNSEENTCARVTFSPVPETLTRAPYLTEHLW